MRRLLANLSLLLVAAAWTSCAPPESVEQPPAQEAAESSQPIPPPPEPAAPSEAAPAPNAPLEFRALASGLEVFEGKVATRDGPLDFLVARSSRERPVALNASMNPKAPGRSLLGYHKESGASVIISGGFLKSFYPPLPLGVVKVQDQVLNRSVEPGELLNGLLCVREEAPTITRLEDPSRLDRCRDGLQSGPLIVLDGAPALPGDLDSVAESTRELIAGRYHRAFVAVDEDGRFLAGWTGQVALPLLARILSRPVDQGGFGCRAVLNLSGAESAGILIAAPDARLERGSIDLRLPNAITIR